MDWSFTEDERKMIIDTLVADTFQKLAPVNDMFVSGFMQMFVYAMVSQNLSAANVFTIYNDNMFMNDSIVKFTDSHTKCDCDTILISKIPKNITPQEYFKIWVTRELPLIDDIHGLIKHYVVQLIVDDYFKIIQTLYSNDLYFKDNKMEIPLGSELIKNLQALPQFRGMSEYAIRKKIGADYNVKRATNTQLYQTLQSLPKIKSVSPKSSPRKSPSTPQYVNDFESLLRQIPTKSRQKYLELLLNVILVINKARIAYRFFIDNKYSTKVMNMILEYYPNLVLIEWDLEAEPLICLDENKTLVENELRKGHTGMAKILSYCYNKSDWNNINILIG